MSNDAPSLRRRIIATHGQTGAGKETDCIRCMACEVICSFMKERVVNPELSRIKVVPAELQWIEGDSNKIVSHKICHNCPDITPCMKACPEEGAIFRDQRSGTVIIDHLKCNRCKKCVDACPFDAIWFNDYKNEVIKCDLCGGEPECVEWCPVGVLKIVEIIKEKSNE